MVKKKRIRIRIWVQVFFFILVAAIVVNHNLAETGNNVEWLANASLHSICPFGGVVSIYQYATLGSFAKKIHESSWVLMLIVFGLAVFVGPAFCGWVCPLGSFQEWIGKLGKKLFKGRYNRFIPYRFDKWLRYARYIMLGWVLFMTARSGILIFQDIDPYYALFNLWTGEVAVSGFIALGLVAGLSLFVERPFCKYACPYGAALGLFNLFRVFPIRRNTATCISCRACDKACPMNIHVSDTKAVRDHGCISCMKCTGEEACPVADTVELKTHDYKEALREN